MGQISLKIMFKIVSFLSIDKWVYFAKIILTVG
jgi:hypothetical protein